MTASVPAMPGDHLRALTGIRALAALWVVIFHYTEIRPGVYYLFGFGDRLIRRGSLGVDVFFVLSGFILTHVYRRQFLTSWSASAWVKFLKYRFARLYPVHIVTALIMGCFAIIAARSGFVPQDAYAYSWFSVLSNLTLTHVWFPNVMAMNSPAWSVSAEWFAYLLFPIAYFLLWRAGREWPWVVAIVAMAVALVMHGKWGALIRVSAEFSLGMAAYELHVRYSRKRGRVGGAAFLLLLIASAEFGTWFTTPAVALFSALLFVALASPFDLAGRVLQLKPVMYLGEISYSLYLCHWMVWVALRRGAFYVFGWTRVPHLALMLSGILLSILISMLCFHFLEVPGREALRSFRFAAFLVRRHPERGGVVGPGPSDASFPSMDHT